MNDLSYPSLIARAADRTILVIGDLMLDSYIYGVSHRICREAPVPVVDIVTHKQMPGGAANTALNVRALGAQTRFAAITGSDADTEAVLWQLGQQGVDTSMTLCHAQRQTLVKRRVLADQQLLLRVDSGSRDLPDDGLLHTFIERLHGAFRQADAVLISDYGYGTLAPPVIDALKGWTQARPVPIVVDSKHPDRYVDLSPTAMTPNYGEVMSMLQTDPVEGTARLQQITAMQTVILETTGAQAVIVTLDKHGALVLQRGQPAQHIQTQPVAKPSSAGAGDTFTSALTLALVAGASLEHAARFATVAARVAVSKKDTAICTAQDILRAFDNTAGVILDRGELHDIVAQYRVEGRRVVFTNGCFDILHRGHVSYLEQASALGDVLIVGVNSDASVRRLKGDNRPINTLEDRMRVLASLECIDHVVSFDENTPVALIEMIEPQVYAKGGDYHRDQLPETPTVERLGGQVHILPYYADWSTTNVIRRARRQQADGTGG